MKEGDAVVVNLKAVVREAGLGVQRRLGRDQGRSPSIAHVHGGRGEVIRGLEVGVLGMRRVA